MHTQLNQFLLRYLPYVYNYIYGLCETRESIIDYYKTCPYFFIYSLVYNICLCYCTHSGTEKLLMQDKARLGVSIVGGIER